VVECRSTGSLFFAQLQRFSVSVSQHVLAKSEGKVSTLIKKLKFAHVIKITLVMSKMIGIHVTPRNSYVVVQLVEALCYKPKGCTFASQ
jgi:hypothetical protein